jgi:DNA-binding CsgD family transcriptional regulator
VARRAELELLESAWRAATSGVRQVVLVGGEAGSGKSRLTRAVAGELHAQGARVLTGACTADLGLPFDPLVDPVRVLVTAAEDGDLDVRWAAPSHGPCDVGRLRTLLDGSLHATGAAARLSFDALVSALGAACSTGPVLLALEDLHWAGESGLRAVRYLIEHTDDLSLLVLATFRATAPEWTPLLAQHLAGLARLAGVQRVDLVGLTVPEVADYLVAVGAGTPQEVTAAASVLHHQTGGNPFMLGEVWRELRRRGGLERVADTDIPMPESVRALVAQRLTTLSPSQRRVVNLAAVAGEKSSVELLLAAVGDGLPPAQVYAGIAAAVSAGLLEPVRDGTGHRFPHALARQAALDEMAGYERASCHAAVGLALEHTGEGEGSRLQRLAHHFSNAAGLGYRQRAETYLEQAASSAQSRLANADAAVLFERAAGHAALEADRDRLRLRAARCHHVAGHVSRARELDELVATEGHASARLQAAMGYEASSWRSSGGDADRAVRLLTAALASEASGNGSDRLCAQGHLARALANTGRRDEAVATSRAAVEQARSAGDAQSLMAVLVTDVYTTTGLFRVQERLSAARELSEVARRHGAPRPLGAAGAMRAGAAYTLGLPEDLRAGVADLARMVRATQQPYWLWTSLLIETGQRLRHCDFAGAERSLREGRTLVQGFEGGSTASADDGPASLQTFVLRRETGGIEPLRGLVDGGLDLDDPWRPGLVALGTELGLPDLALPALRAVVADDLGSLRTSATWPAVLSFLGEAAAWLEQPDLAEALLAEAEPHEGLNLLGAEFLAPLGSIHRLIAVLRATVGRSGVEEHFATALEMDERMGSTLHVATTRAAWAAHLVRTRAPARRVEEHASVARDLADRHGLVRVRRLLGPAADGPGAPLPDGLTSREVEVLGLIGRGLSNRDIAATLVISEHTAANHVRSILMKTQSANRTAAAHYAVRHGLIAAPSDP